MSIEIDVRTICGSLLEVKIISYGATITESSIDVREALELSATLIAASGELLDFAKNNIKS